jgi:hypothetical protein
LKSASVPIHIIFSGKAHPNDDVGKKLIRQIYDYSFEDRFIDKIFFVENYDMEVARCMIQGVDLWLNNPARPREASGTSGMKVVINGGLNCSVLDGWWDEAYHNDNGWVIGEKRNYVNRETQDIVDSESFYDVLEKDIIPVFRKRDDGEVPEKWLYMMKQSIKTLVPRFNTHRMLREYYEKLYLPTAIRSERFRKNNYEKAKALSDWKMKIASRFSTDHIRWFRTEGFIGDRIDMGGSFKVEVGVDLGKLDEEEMKLELVILELDEKDKIINTTVVPMKKTSADDKDALIYSCAYEATKSGKFRYGIRAIPRHPDLLVYQEIGLVHWA